MYENFQDKRKRTLDAINHKETDLVPWQFDLTGRFSQKVKEERNCSDPDQYFNNHIYRLKYKKNQVLPDGREKDLFGVIWEKDKKGGDVGIVSEYILKEPTLEHYAFPQVNIELCRNIGELLEADQYNRFRVFSLTMNFFERFWSLRSMENALMDMLLEETFTFELYDKIYEHHMEVLENILSYDFEAVYFGDDWGQQNGLIMGPDLWKKYIKQPMKNMFDKIKSNGKKIILHSCGDLRTIMDDLVDIGLDVYNTVQPEIYNLKELKNKYGNHLTFYGGISTQQFLPYATAQDTYIMSKETLKIMSEGGGYIFSPTHSVTDDIPVNNIDAMINAVTDFY